MTSFKLAIVGEAYGELEDQWKRPFVGPAGQELDRILADAGIERGEVFLTNVFNLRPLSNNIASLCGKKSDGDIAGHLPSLVPGLYLKSQYLSEVDRLYAELRDIKPNLAILLGNTACWALLGQTAISKIRGTCSVSPRIEGLKCLPTFHPAAVLRQYDLRHVTVLDFLKAKREREFPELRRPVRTIEIAESPGDIRAYIERYLKDAEYISFDIETAGEQITCIGFASSIDRALVIPFVDNRSATGSYWASLELEREAWQMAAEILLLPAMKLGQNVLYDVQYLWMKMGIPVANLAHDTMLLHHSLLPESDKGLGFLGSVYTNEPAWKAERPRGEKTIKREDA